VSSRAPSLVRSLIAAVLVLLCLPAPGSSAQEALILQSGRGLGATMAFSPDGRTLGTANEAGVVLIDVATQRERSFWPSADGLPNALTFSPDGRWVAVGYHKGRSRSGNAPGIVKIWDANTGQEHRILARHRTGVVGVAFSSDGRRLISVGANATTIVWYWPAGRVARIVSHPRDEFLGTVTLSPDGGALVVVSGQAYRSWWIDCAAVMYEATSRRVLGTAPCPIASLQPFLAVSPGNRWIVLDDTLFELAKPGGDQRDASPGADGSAHIVAFGAHDVALVSRSGDDPTLTAWDLANRRPLRSVQDRAGASAVFAPAGDIVAVQTAFGRIAFYDFPAMTLRGELVPPKVDAWNTTGPLPIADYSPDGRELAVVDAASDIGIFDTATWRRIRVLKHRDCDYTTGIRYSPAGDQLVSTCNGGESMQTWNRASGTLQGSFGRSGNDRFAFAGGGRQVVRTVGSLEERSVQVVDITTGALVRSLPIPGDDVRVTADGRIIVGLGIYAGPPPWGGLSLQLSAWSWETGEALWQLSDSGSFEISPDGRTIARGSRLYDVETGAVRRTLSPPRPLGSVLAFSPDGRFLAASLSTPSRDEDRDIIVWDTKTWQELVILTGHTGPIGHLVFSPDSTHLVSVSHDFTVRVWTMTSGTSVGQYTVPLGPRPPG